MFGPRPLRAAGRPRTVRHVDLATGAVGPATPAEAALLDPADSDIYGVPPAAESAWGRAWFGPADPASPSASIVHIATSGGRASLCNLAPCRGRVLGLWWHGRDLLILRREGWADEAQGLYRWRVGARTAGRLLLTKDAIHGCVLTRFGLLCTDEAARTPRRLVLIDARTGHVRPILDLNPEFAAITLGTVRRLRWRNDLGFACCGDLVLPPDYRSGQRLPLIVVQYHSDGFLRGGTGDEYPIFLLASHGMAVLSIERSQPVSAGRTDLASIEKMLAAEMENWAARRNLLSTVDRGVDRVIDSGIADPRRLGITGLSDGATTVAFALINHPRYAAAAMSTCCNEPDSMMTYAGLREAGFFGSIGYPPVTAHDTRFWQAMSLAQNAATMRTPLLLQVADSEYLLALQAFGALVEKQAPVEMYVFPGEYHEKVQPAHRLAIYRRNDDWFQFWLKNVRDPSPAKDDQYRRWAALRARAAPPLVPISSSTAPTPPRRPVPSP